MSELPEAWEVLLEKARGDAKMLAGLLSDSEQPDWGLGFHAQQAVEKSVKAVLSRKAIRYPFKHDLEGLLELAASAGVPLPPDSAELPRLTPFGAI